MPETAEAPSVAQQYNDIEQVHKAACNRLADLQNRAHTDILSAEEELEQLQLERRIANLEPHRERLRRQVMLERDKLDIEAVVEEWAGLVQEKHQAYELFLLALVQLKQTYLGILGVHQKQEQAVGRLPRGVQTRLSFPDEGTLKARIAGRMRDATGWTEIMCAGESFAMPDLAAVMDADPGTKELSPRMIQRFIEESSQWKQRQ